MHKMPQCIKQVMNGSGMVGIKGGSERVSACINIISLMPTRKVRPTLHRFSWNS